MVRRCSIYVANPTVKFRSLSDEKGDASLTATCSIQVFWDSSSDLCHPFTLTFNQNKAGKAGNAIYGGHTLACLPYDSECVCTRSVPLNTLYIYNPVNDSSYLSNFTSDPTRVCFCENSIPNCYRVLSDITVHPGERLYLPLAIVGYGLGTVPGSVVASNTARPSKHRLLGSACPAELSFL